MPISVLYSVKTDDIEEARAWVEAATGLVAEGRESSFWGGDYYAFQGNAGEELKVITNRDLFDGELIIGDDPAVLIGLIVDEAEPDSALLGALNHAPDKFAKLSESLG
jgi:hypothetical protein